MDKVDRLIIKAIDHSGKINMRQHIKETIREIDQYLQGLKTGDIVPDFGEDYQKLCKEYEELSEK